MPNHLHNKHKHTVLSYLTKIENNDVNIKESVSFHNYTVPHSEHILAL